MVVLCASRGASAESTSPNLLLITIDTLRADHLSCNGARNVTTPNLDRLAGQGVNFRRARTSVPLTLPSHASILTGNFPPTHGIRDNASSRLPESQITLGEALQASGYETAAFLGSFVLDRRFGLAQGFDVYDDRVAEAPETLESLEAERSAEEVFSAFESWFSSRATEMPFFAWLHFYDPHAPYSPPEPFATRFKSDPYAGEVAYVDEIVGRVVALVDRKGLARDRVIAVVGDHGEGLGEHGENTHSLLIYNSTLHVPAILVAPGRIGAGGGVDSLVRTIDLAPTILELLGLPATLGQGRSLMPLLDEEQGGSPTGDASGPPSYAESLYAQRNLGWSSIRGLETETHRLILGPDPELYDLKSDPEERRDLANELPELVEDLTAQLERLVPARQAHDPGRNDASLDPETVEQLRSLGYLAGSSSPPAVIGKNGEVSPRKSIDDWEHIEDGLRHYALGDFLLAAGIFESVLKTHPRTPLLYEYLGSCFERSGKVGEAERIYRKAVSMGLGSADFHLGLARIAIGKGDTAVAERELLSAVELDPLSVVAHHTLGDVYRGREDFERAEEQFRAALEINPAYIYSWNGLGMVLGGQGDDVGALEAFQRAVKAAPGSPLPYMNLAVQLERMDRVFEARSAYEKFLDLAEDQADLNRERSLAESALQRLEN